MEDYEIKQHFFMMASILLVDMDALFDNITALKFRCQSRILG